MDDAVLPVIKADAVFDFERAAGQLGFGERLQYAVSIAGMNELDNLVERNFGGEQHRCAVDSPTLFRPANAVAKVKLPAGDSCDFLRFAQLQLASAQPFLGFATRRNVDDGRARAAKVSG